MTSEVTRNISGVTDFLIEGKGKRKNHQGKIERMNEMEFIQFLLKKSHQNIKQRPEELIQLFNGYNGLLKAVCSAEILPGGSNTQEASIYNANGCKCHTKLWACRLCYHKYRSKLSETVNYTIKPICPPPPVLISHLLIFNYPR
jgi:hypothetical protein